MEEARDKLLTVGFENIIQFAIIFALPDDTLTRQRLCLIFEISICSANVKVAS